MTDGELVRETIAGRWAAYAELVERWSARILAVCRARVRFDQAEDLAQESFVRGLQSLATLHDAEKFGPWLRGIAIRACLDWLKAKQTGQQSFSALEEREISIEPLAREEAVDVALERRESLAELSAAIAELPETYRETLLLYYSEELTYQELAEWLGISFATVNLRLTKGRALLRQKLVERCRHEL